jgi:MFS family permease
VAKVRANRNEWLLVMFAASTNIADAVTRVAVPLLAVRLTSSPALIAMVTTLMMLPWLVVALHIGVLVDRKNRRSLMFGAEVARLASIGVLLVAYLTDTLSLTLVFVMSVALGVASVLAQTAEASIVPSAVPRARLQTANARITGVEYLCSGFVGTPVGGLLVAAGFALALGATSLMYVVGAVLLVLLVGNFAVQSTQERKSVNAEIGDGLRFLWRHKLLRTIALLVASMAGTWTAWYAIIPAYAVSGPLDLTAGQYGFLLGALGAGGVVGTFVVGPVNRLIGRRWSMFVDIVGTVPLVGVPALLPATPASAWFIGAAAFLAGVGGTMWNVNTRMIYQTLVPNDMLGRFTAASRLIGRGATPLAAAVVGVLATAFGYQVAFGVFAVMSAVLVVPFLRVVTAASLSDVDKTEEPVATSPGTGQ